MPFASQTLEPCPQERNKHAKSWLRRLPGLSRLIILFLMVGSTYGLCMHHAEQLGAVASANQAKSESTTGKRPVTEADSIRMTRLGDRQYTLGNPSKGLVARFSPDGKRFVVVLRKGNFEANTNEYSLNLFETSEVFHSPAPRLLASMASSSNRPAIQNVVWMEDNDTILFLGEHPGETTQLYSFKCSTNRLTRLTHHATNLTSFLVAAKGAEMVFTAETPEVSYVNDNSLRNGIVVTDELLPDLIAGKHGGQDYDAQALFVTRNGSEAETPIKTEGDVGLYTNMSLSPDGAHLIIMTEATRIPDAWSAYGDPYLKGSGRTLTVSTSIFQYELLDLATGTSRLLLDAPIVPMNGSEVAWSPDSQSVAVSETYLPLNAHDTAEVARKKAHPFLVEVNISNRQSTTISHGDLRLLEWNADAVVCDVGRLDSLNGKTTPKAYFRKNKGTWTRSVSGQEQKKTAASLPEVVLEEDMHTPPRIFSVDGDGHKSLFMDLNPQFRDLAFAKVEEVTFKTPQHNEIKAGLYWPLDYAAGRRYPLVIQTHAWSSDRFWIDGPWTSGFAAQALAGKGLFVLQISEANNLGANFSYIDTPKELPAVMSVYDSAIDFMNRKGLIDPSRIGIIGFSRTFLYVTYTLTHSKHHFAAAAVIDGADYGYFPYMALLNFDETENTEIERLYGTPPFGKGLLQWFKVSPAFLMDRVEAPLRIQPFGPGSLLTEWHWYSGLKRLHKPVEMIYIPSGDHILEKPWERMTSQQGDVDWFCFWLKGEEDPGPNKAEQYRRWRNLRSLTPRSDATSRPH